MVDDHWKGWMAVINGRVFAKLDEIRRNLAILPLHWESRALGNKGLILAL